MSKYEIELKQEIQVEFLDEKKASAYLVDEGNGVHSFDNLGDAAKELSMMASGSMSGEYWHSDNCWALDIEGFATFKRIDGELVSSCEETGVIKIYGDDQPEPF